MIKFIPSLTDQKIKAINDIGIEDVGKLFIRFNKTIFPNNA